MDTTNDTVGMICEELVETDRLYRFCAHVAQRLDRLAALMQIGSIRAASGALVSLISHFPEWVSADAAVAGAMQAIRRYPEKAVRKAELCRDLARERLWGDVEEREEAELREEREALSRHLAAIVDRAPLELPYARSLARRSEREGDQYWTERYASP